MTESERAEVAEKLALLIEEGTSGRVFHRGLYRGPEFDARVIAARSRA